MDAGSRNQAIREPSPDMVVSLEPNERRIETNQCARSALRYVIWLLLLACQHMRPRTLVMYRYLVSALFTQREHIAASFVFEMMVKDPQLLITLPHTIQTLPVSYLIRDDLKKRYAHLEGENILIDPEILESICVALDRKSWQAKDYPPNKTLQRCLQSLIIFAALLDLRKLPFGNMNALLTTLTSCLDSGASSVEERESRLDMVWADVEPKLISISALVYVGEVLASLINNLPRLSL
ncbi:hypothetical protein Hypma_004815 [Hypsizygus marmoreus]|uniref:Uncharacterized protein n=1 Tax=Hypsizygus marmoreus TaxID=39966 RepID=A0A369IZK0_HYPMA|nr:hypothetical protein Hypma_004815 [Hypsizygus marmoreus]